MHCVRSKMILTILFALMLGNCAPPYSRHDWSGFVSKSETLRFLAVASCNTPDFLNPVRADAAFFKVNRLDPTKGEPWTYNAELVGEAGMRRGKFIVSQWWSAAGVTTAPRSVANDRICNVLAEVPVSRNARQPYYVEPEAVKTAEYKALTLATPLKVLFLVFVGSALFLSFWGFERFGEWGSCAGFLLAVIGASAVLYYLCVEGPWQEYQQALAFLKFFEQLPRTANGDLLPISPQQLAYLVAGPPHPHSTEFHFEVFAWIAGGLTGLWLLISIPFVVRGIYWLAVPLPLEELHQHALRAGRAPTAAEVTAAVLSACTGKAAWQHRIMQRKAEAFTRNIREINRHLYPGG
jgi:hypothetical protein